MSKRLKEIAIRNLYKPGKRLPALGKPFALKNRVAERSQERNEASCLGEMSVLLDCWKANNFNDISCAKEIKGLQKCIAETAANKGSRSDALTSKELNVILRKHPLPTS